jgi:hypothetical protein
MLKNVDDSENSKGLGAGSYFFAAETSLGGFQVNWVKMLIRKFNVTFIQVVNK